VRIPSLILLAGMLPAAGCAGPEIAVRHVLPADLPVPPDAVLAVGDVQLADGGPKAYADFTAAELNRRIRAAGRGDGAGPKMTLSADLHVRTDETQATRTVRRYNPRRRKTEQLEVPTLVRTAAVRAVFVVSTDSPDRRIGAAETRDSYNSADDPRTRGRLGLDRPDRPDFVPPAETIVRELLAGCVGQFWRMIQPPHVEAKLRLRPAPGQAGRRGLEAAAEGKFPEAVRHLAAALAARPDSADLRFDLAACAEAAGNLPEALRHYASLVKTTAGKDAEARGGAERVRRILDRTAPKLPQKPPG